MCLTKKKPLLIQVGEKIWQSLSAVKYGTSLLIEVAKHNPAMLLEVVQNLKTKLPPVNEKDETERTKALRILFLFAELSRQNEEMFRLLESEHCLELVVQKFETDDVLELLTVVELLEQVLAVVANPNNVTSLVLLSPE